MAPLPMHNVGPTTATNARTPAQRLALHAPACNGKLPYRFVHQSLLFLLDTTPEFCSRYHLWMRRPNPARRSYDSVDSYTCCDSTFLLLFTRGCLHNCESDSAVTVGYRYHLWMRKPNPARRSYDSVDSYTCCESTFLPTIHTWMPSQLRVG